MPEKQADVKPDDLTVKEWVNSARSDPVKFRDRQVTHVLLHAIGRTRELQELMVLKGGALLMMGFNSPRGTQDVDFSVTADPEPFASQFADLLNPSMVKSAIELGYVDLICRVQKIKKRPKDQNFENAQGPALNVTIAHAIRGTKEEDRLNDRKAIRVVQVDVSFKEEIIFDVDRALQGSSIIIRTYGVEEIISEKLRAVLQQPVRNRSRRQDIYDLYFLLIQQEDNEEVRYKIKKALVRKAISRDMDIHKDTIDDPEIRKRSGENWSSLTDEVPGKLPDFDKLFDYVVSYYKSLPW